MGFLKKNSHFLLALFVFTDFVILFASYIVSVLWTSGSESLYAMNIREVLTTSVVLVFLFFILQKLEFNHKYRIRPLFRVIAGVFAFEFTTVNIFYISKLLKIYPYQDELILKFTIITFSIFMAERVIVKIGLSVIRKSGFNYKKYLIVGAGSLGINFYKMIQSSNEYGIKIIGFLDDKKEELKISDKIPDEVKKIIVGETARLEYFLQNGLVDNVIIALPMMVGDKIINITNLCEQYGIKAELIPDYYKIVSKKPSIRIIKGFPLIGIRNVPLENLFNRLIKRLFDIIVSSIILVLCIPIFAVTALFIKATSKGPVLFKQKRTGIKQKEFEIYKFRTMYMNSSSDILKAVKDDPRKTPIGNFLRRTNIDELPQLINILKGEMSLVGPRPHMISQTEEYYKKYDKYLVRHWVKPGLTGWAQVNGWRGDSDIGMRVKFDIDYIENWTFLLDIKIIFLTAFGKKVRKNAY